MSKIYTDGYNTVCSEFLSKDYFLSNASIPLDVKIAICAQWALESGWGKSKLARDYNNYGGLKWREEIGDKFPNLVREIEYLDWEEIKKGQKSSTVGNTEIYIINIKDFPKVYLGFLERDIYSGIDFYLSDAETYLRFLVSRGYVASMDGISPDKIEEYYVSKIFDIMSRSYFKSMCNAIICD